MHFYAPVSMTALNANVNSDLVFSGAWNQIRRIDNNQGLYLAGGDGFGNSANYGINGKNNVGSDHVWMCVNAAKNPITFMWIDGKTDTPSLTINNHRIAGLSQATNVGDALPLIAWADWTPTLVWATATPSGITTIARWVQIGRVVFWRLNISSADSNATTGLTATLPVMPAAGGASVFTVAPTLIQATWYIQYVFVTQTGAENRLQFLSFQAGIDNQVINISASGFYEVA